MQRRDFPIIELAPWEHLPNCPPADLRAAAQNVEAFVWRGKTPQIAARFSDIGNHYRFLFARVVGDESAGHWVLRDGYQRAEPARFNGGERLKLPYRLSMKRRGDVPFGRLFCFGADAPLAFVGADGLSCWLPSTRMDAYELSAPFCIPLERGRSLFDSNALEVRDLLESKLACPDSDTCFARGWLSLSEEARQTRALRTGRGSVEEMQSLMRAVLRLEVENLEAGREVAWCLANDEEGSMHRERPIGSRGGFLMPSSLRLSIWQRLFVAWFEPSLDGALLARCLCVRRWRERLAELSGKHT